MKGLTKKQRDILTFIADFAGVNGMPPTIYEIADRFRIRPPTVSEHIKSLAAKGFVSRTSKARSIVLTMSKRLWIRQTAFPVAVPLIDTGGRMASARSGDRHAASQFVYFDKSLVRDLGRDEAWAFVMTGHSMDGLGFQDGDVLVVSRVAKPVDGDAVLVRLTGGEMIVRTYHPTRDAKIELRPASTEFISVFFKPSELDLLGVVVGVQRSLWRGAKGRL